MKQLIRGVYLYLPMAQLSHGQFLGGNIFSIENLTEKWMTYNRFAVIFLRQFIVKSIINHTIG